MKLIKLSVLVLLLFSTGIGDAMARRGHGHHGPRIHFGLAFGPYWGPWYPPHYYSPVVIERASPPVYIERSSDSGAANFWYYCAAAKGYYPYVKQCPGGWQLVAPRPEDQP
jgi:hypothetical protein